MKIYLIYSINSFTIFISLNKNALKNYILILKKIVHSPSNLFKTHKSFFNTKTHPYHNMNHNSHNFKFPRAQDE